MHTKDILAGELEKAGLTEMAKQARTGYYHDFLSPLAMPEMQLVNDLTEQASEARATSNFDKMENILRLRKRVIDGDFDASVEESDEWAASPEGQEAFGRLINEGE